YNKNGGIVVMRQKLPKESSKCISLTSRSGMVGNRRKSVDKLVYPELHNGDCMTRAEFHSIYEQMPDDFKAELIDGTVYVCEPLGMPHGRNHLHLGSLLLAYQAATPGVQAYDNVTIFLNDKNEVQPDLFLRILPNYGGQSGSIRKHYVDGAPELVAEI